MGNYASTSYVAQYMQVDATNAYVLADLVYLIAIAEELIDLYCGTTFVSTGGSDVAKYFDGNGTDIIVVKPVIRVLTSVDIVDDSNVVLSTLTDCAMYPTEGLNSSDAHLAIARRRNGTFPVGLGNVKVTGKFGLTTVPEALKLATALTAKYVADLRLQNETFSSEEMMDRHIKYRDSKDSPYLPPTAKGLLERWRAWNMDVIV